MVAFYEHATGLTVEELETFINIYDRHGVFSTKDRWHDNFVLHFKKVMAANQILTFRDADTGGLLGFLDWAMVTHRNKHDINKARWELPDNITDGNILYVSTCLVMGDINLWKVKRFLTEKYRSVLKEVFWYDVPHSRFFRSQFKGEVSCPQSTAV